MFVELEVKLRIVDKDGVKLTTKKRTFHVYALVCSDRAQKLQVNSYLSSGITMQIRQQPTSLIKPVWETRSQCDMVLSETIDYIDAVSGSLISLAPSLGVKEISKNFTVTLEPGVASIAQPSFKIRYSITVTSSSN